MDATPVPSRELYARLGTAAAPVLVDVRRAEAFGADNAVIIGATHRPPQREEPLAISCGLPANFRDDYDMLKHGLVIYDALYSWCRLQQAKPRV